MKKKETEFGHQCIDRLFESSNIVIKTEAAAYCLALDYKVPYAESVLQEIADNPDNKINIIYKISEKELF